MRYARQSEVYAVSFSNGRIKEFTNERFSKSISSGIYRKKGKKKNAFLNRYKKLNKRRNDFMKNPFDKVVKRIKQNKIERIKNKN